MNKATISAVIVAKNEEKNIRKCLESIKWVDEIIFIDNYSNDKTLEIAKKYTDKIWIRKGGKYNLLMNNINFGFKKATKKWILIIDADETITKDCRKEILEKIKEDKFDAFYFNFKQFFFGKEFVGPLWTKTKIIRLFKKGKGCYENLGPHNTLKINGSIGRIESPIIHNGYPDIETYIKKMNHYTSQEARLLSEGKIAGILKRRKSRINIYNLLIEPILFFLNIFIIKKNYKDGIHGLILSVLMSFYLFVERAKLWILNKKNQL